MKRYLFPIHMSSTRYVQYTDNKMKKNIQNNRKLQFIN